MENSSLYEMKKRNNEMENKERELFQTARFIKSYKCCKEELDCFTETLSDLNNLKNDTTKKIPKEIIENAVSTLKNQMDDIISRSPFKVVPKHGVPECKIPMDDKTPVVS